MNLIRFIDFESVEFMNIYHVCIIISVTNYHDLLIKKKLFIILNVLYQHSSDEVFVGLMQVVIMFS